MDGSVGVVEKLERGLGRDRTLAQEKREHEAGRCRADRGREQMLGITQELEVRLGLWIEADAACQGIAVEGGASAPLAGVAGGGRGQFLDRYRGGPKPKAGRAPPQGRVRTPRARRVRQKRQAGAAKPAQRTTGRSRQAAHRPPNDSIRRRETR